MSTALDESWWSENPPHGLRCVIIWVGIFRPDVTERTGEKHHLGSIDWEFVRFCQDILRSLKVGEC